MQDEPPFRLQFIKAVGENEILLGTSISISPRLLSLNSDIQQILGGLLQTAD